MSLTADEIKSRFDMQPHPTCGFFTQSYESNLLIPQSVLSGYDGARPLASALYFLVTQDAHTVLHHIRSDQMYHHYLGDPLEVLLLHRDGRGEVVTVGPDLSAGMRPQLLVPGMTFHISRVRPGGDYAFMGTTAWPSVTPDDLEIGDPEALSTTYPAMREQIAAFTHQAPAPSAG
jgi:predicted cupin superfamily sugar epimerase